MAQLTLTGRVEILEGKVALLEQLPERVDRLEVQILQLREEMRSEFAAVRAEMREGDRSVIQQLREEIRAGDEETRRYMRVLHENVIARIAAIGESPRAPRKRR